MERNGDLKRLSQQLRKNPTKEEHYLWHGFLRRYPCQVRRQYIIGNYIVDFFCYKARLVVELDGSQHYMPQGMAKDEQRTEYLQSLDIAVLRFSNLDVLKRFDSVCEKIDAAVRERVSLFTEYGEKL